MKKQRIVLPERFSPSEELAAATATAVAEETAPHIVVVEDDHDCSMGLAVWLDQLGHTVATIGDGSEAIRWIDAHEPVVALLDLGLPGMHGLKILHEIRMRRLATKVVVLTAAWEHGTAAKAIALGAHEVMRKPVDLDQLRVILEDLLPKDEPPPRPGRRRTSGSLRDLDDAFDTASLLMAWARRQKGARSEVTP